VTAFITNDEFTAAPTGVDVSNLNAASVSSTAQSGQLTQDIARVTSLIHGYCQQRLIASTRSETRRLRFDSEGNLSIHPDWSPVIAVMSVAYGSAVNQLVPVADLSSLFVERQTIVLQPQALSTVTSQGPLQIGAPTYGQRIVCTYVYTHGWVSTTIPAATTVGETSITVADGTGVITSSYTGPNTDYTVTPGQYTIYDPNNPGGDFTETVTVTAVNGDTLTLASPGLAYAHGAGVGFSNLPGALKQAAIRGTSALIKSRGDVGMLMTQLQNPGQPIGLDKGAWTDILAMRDALDDGPYKRIR